MKASTEKRRGFPSGTWLWLTVAWIALAAWARPGYTADPGRPLVLGIQDDQAGTQELAREYGMQPAASTTLTFANGNTGFRLEQNVQYQDVYINVPKTLTADQLIQLLFMSETARTGFARRVILASSIPLSEVKVVGSGSPIPLDLAPLFRAAGAEYVAKSGEDTLAPKALPPSPLNEIKDAGDGLVLQQGHPDLAQALARKMSLPLMDNASSDGIHGRQIYLVGGFGPPANEHLLRTISLAQRLTSHGNQVHLVTPYLPYARSDKIDQPGVAVLGSLVIRMLRASGAQAMTMVRPHAPQSQGFFEGPSFHLSGRPTLLKYLKDKNISVVISPDAGFQKDADNYAHDLHVEDVAVVNKEREKGSGQDVNMRGGTNGDKIKGKNVVITDDEIGSGKTLAQAAEWAHANGANEVYVVASHLTGTAEAALASPYIKEIVVLDTLPFAIQHPKLKVMSVADEVGGALRELEEARRKTLGSCFALARVAAH